MRRELLVRVRWGNVGLACGALVCLAAVIAWPRLVAAGPRLPADAARPLVAEGPDAAAGGTAEGLDAASGGAAEGLDAASNGTAKGRPPREGRGRAGAGPGARARGGWARAPRAGTPPRREVRPDLRTGSQRDARPRRGPGSGSRPDAASRRDAETAPPAQAPSRRDGRAGSGRTVVRPPDAPPAPGRATT